MKSRSRNSPVYRSWCFGGARATRPFREAKVILIALRLDWRRTLLPGRRPALLLLAALCLLGPATAKADVDVSKLPPAKPGAVEFDRDVRPILEESCLRCHGPERPKSGFRLDNRESALKGGNNNTDDIVPGDSARSVLIHYVSGIVEDIQMPPPGKGEPLTPEQIGVLRAWIDQGANWGAANSFPQITFSLSPTIRWTGVDGDKSKFRELQGFKEGLGGGIEHFSWEQRQMPDENFSVEGHVLFPEDDLKFKLALTKANVGFVRVGFETWRRYYDDTGGYYPLFPQPSFDLNRDLHLDVGRAWIDFGLTLPDLPQIVLGYEFQFRDGTKSMLEWGPVNNKNIYPAAKQISERVHIIKLDLTQDVDDWHFENNARVEFYSNDTHDRQITSYTVGPAPDALVKTHEDASHIQGVNTFRIEKQITDWWFSSWGYLYSKFDGSSALNQATVNSSDVPVSGKFWNNDVVLRRDADVLSLANLFSPLDGFTLSLNLQSEFSHQEGFGDISLDEGDPNAPVNFLRPARIQSDLAETKTAQNALLRYTKIPFTVLFADARFAQDGISQFEQQSSNSAPTFLRDTDYDNLLQDYRVGFNTSPWRWVALNTQYRHRDSDSDYDHLRDESLNGGNGYSAFIRHREMETDEVETKLVLHPVSWLKNTLTYQWSESEFSTATDPATDPLLGTVSPGGSILAGKSRANVYGVSATFTPSYKFYFTGTFTYSTSRMVSKMQNSTLAVVPYRGDIYNVIASANYTLNPRTTCQASYWFSRADYSQDNSVDGLPLGIDYTRHGVIVGLTRKITAHLSSHVRYSFYHYDEPSAGGFNDFTAHGVFATVTLNWP